MNKAISDWDDEYANGAYIPGAEKLPAQWMASASAWRDKMQRLDRCQLDVAYGDQTRQRYDIFQPSSAALGTVVFVHGGYWKSTDKSYWSHLAAGSVARGWRVIIPGYTLCPDNTITGITGEVSDCIAHSSAADELPLRLAGHSAGGHLVSRMACQNSPLPTEVQKRIDAIVSISGVHDLRPLQNTRMNEILKLDDTMAVTESPV